MGVTRRDFRRDIMRDLGDLRVLTATAPGSDLTFVDAQNLTGEPGAYSGREVLFTAGTPANIGMIRYVTGSSSSSRAIGWGVSLPSDTATLDECEMVNSRGTGYRFDDVHEAINRSIRAVKDKALIPSGIDLVDFARGVPIDVPAEWATIEGIEWQSSTDSTMWHSIPMASRVNGNGWFADPFTRTVTLNGHPAMRANGRSVRMWGLTEPIELYHDDDESDVDYDYIVMQAQANLSRARHLRMPTPETQRTMEGLQGMAISARARTITPRSPFSVDLR